MSRIDQIQNVVRPEMQEFEQRFRLSMKSNVALLDAITHYIVKRKGKQMRPLFVFLSAKACGHIGETTYRAASIVELMHTATLVHDDVVDDSNERRGFFSLNALWKNKIAVLVGDYLLSRSLLLATENGDFETLGIISRAVRQMSEGELLQIEKARRLDIRDEVYYEIIEGKTASLVAACCAAGAASVGASPETVEILRKFGLLVGMAFQIKDDLFDVEEAGSIGKPTGIDIKEQKMTLPLIYALSAAPFLEKRRIIRLIKYQHDNPRMVAQVLDFVRNSGGVEYARQKMREYRQQALDCLQNLPASEARQALADLVEYTTERNR